MKKRVARAAMSNELSAAVLQATQRVASANGGDESHRQLVERGRQLVAAFATALTWLEDPPDSDRFAEAKELIERHHDALFGLERRTRARMSFLHLLHLQATTVAYDAVEERAVRLIRTFRGAFAEEANKLDPAKVAKAIALWEQAATGDAAKHMVAAHEAIRDFDPDIELETLRSAWRKLKPGSEKHG